MSLGLKYKQGGFIWKMMRASGTSGGDRTLGLGNSWKGGQLWEMGSDVQQQEGAIREPLPLGNKFNSFCALFSVLRYITRDDKSKWPGWSPHTSLLYRGEQCKGLLLNVALHGRGSVSLCLLLLTWALTLPREHHLHDLI